MSVSTHPEIVRIALPTPFPVGPVNAFLIKGDPPILVDAGARSDEAYAKLAQRLEEHGLKVGDLGIILLTHGHLDHVGLVGDILRESSAEVYAHPLVAEQYANYEKETDDNLHHLIHTMRRFGVPEETVAAIAAVRSTFHSLAAPFRVHHALEDSAAVAGFSAYHVPGHSASDVLFYHPEDRIAFTGDHLIRNVTPNPLIRRPRKGQARARSLVEYQDSLQRTRALDIETCYPGHGGPFGDHRHVVDNLFHRHERRTADVRTLLASGPLTPYELATILFPKLSLKVLHLGLSVAIGHLEVLEERGLAVAEERDGVVCFALSADAG